MQCNVMEKQIVDCIRLCGGSSVEERFAGLFLLSKIPQAQEKLVEKESKQLVTDLWRSLTKDNFLQRLLFVPAGALEVSESFIITNSDGNIVLTSEMEDSEPFELQAQIALNVLMSVFSRHIDVFVADVDSSSSLLQRVNQLLSTKSFSVAAKLDAANFLSCLFGAAVSANLPRLRRDAELVLDSCISMCTAIFDAASEDLTSGYLRLISTVLLWRSSLLTSEKDVKLDNLHISTGHLVPFIISTCGLIASSPAALKADSLAVLVGILSEYATQQDRAAVTSVISEVAEPLRAAVCLFLSSKLPADLRELTLSLSKVRCS